MATQGGSGSALGVEPIDERLHELVAAEVTCGILDATPMIFGTVKEGIMKIMKERLRSFRVEIATGQIRTRTPSLLEFMVCREPEIFGAKDPIASHRWIADMENAQRTSFFPEVAKVGFMSCMLRDRVQNW